MADKFDEMARVMIAKAAKRSREDWQIDIAILLRQSHADGRAEGIEAVCEIAAEARDTAATDEHDDKEALGDMYDHNSYGTGWNKGSEATAEYIITEARALTTSTDGASK